MQKILIVMGLVLILLGVFYPILLHLRLGHLPGDIIFKRGNFTFYFPLMTCIIISIVLSLIIWIVHK